MFALCTHMLRRSGLAPHALAGLLWPLLAPVAHGQSVNWPPAGPERGYLNLQGFVDTVPDIVGPVDGSAKLTIFTEGNHFPVLLPLLFESFPPWCLRAGDCAIGPEEILVVTLPQTMIVETLLKGGVRLGNAVIPVGREHRVFPDVVMGGSGPLKRLAAAGIVESRAIVFAHHRGLGLLLSRTLFHIDDLASFAAGVQRLVLASTSEPSPREAYIATLRQLIGGEATARLLAREIPAFPGRMGIQHRDVPYALLNDLADGGIIFAHLARYYARSYPDRLRDVAVPEAAAFGRDIALAQVIGKRRSVVDAFVRFFLAMARTAYPDAGFSTLGGFAYGSIIDLSP